MPSLSIMDWWSQLAGPEQIFWAIAMVSSLLFFIVFILSLFGLDLDSDVDVDMDVDLDVDMDSGFSLDSDFSAFSFRSIVAFFTFFGWAGVLVMGNGGSVGLALISALVSGLAALFVVAYLMFAISRMDESGTTDLHHALLREGEVYLSIPPIGSGKGKVHIEVDGSLKELDAVSDGREIKTGSKVKVVDILEDYTLVVEELPLLESSNKS